MRHRWLAAILLIVIVSSATPVGAEVVEIEPRQEPTTMLDQAATQKLAMLEGSAFQAFASEISPDDTTLVYAVFKPGDDGPGFMFLNINDGSIRPVGEVLTKLPLFSELRWRDDHTVVYLSLQPRV